MGIALAKMFDLFSGKDERRLLMLGLDAAGKTTLLYSLKLGEEVHTVPTIGFNCERLEYKRTEFVAWDVGGQDKIRRLWKHYFAGTDGLCWIVDSADHDRIDEAKEELHKLLAQDELRDAKLLVFANKQDLPRALSPAQLADRLGLHELRGRDWFIQGANAKRGDGLYEGLDWLVTAMKKKATH